jgi:transposase
MRTPDEVAAMLRLKSLGWGVRRIAREFGCSHTTVRRYLAAGGWLGYRPPSRCKRLDGMTDWLAERTRRHAGNAVAVRRELQAERGVVVSLRTVERAVKQLRGQLWSEARANTLPETVPDESMQFDFGGPCFSIESESRPT